MLGYADYVFTGTFAFEIILKVTGCPAVSKGPDPVCGTQPKMECFELFLVFFSSVIRLHFFFPKPKDYFFQAFQLKKIFFNFF